MNHARVAALDESDLELSTFRWCIQGQLALKAERCFHEMLTGSQPAQCGFATTQEAYESHIHTLFESLDRIEGLLKGKDYLVGNTFTEADVRLFTTIVSAPIQFDITQTNTSHVILHPRFGLIPSITVTSRYDEPVVALAYALTCIAMHSATSRKSDTSTPRSTGG